MKAARDAVADIDGTLVVIGEVEKKGYDVSVDAEELREQVQWAEEVQELWLQAIGEVRAKWEGRVVPCGREEEVKPATLFGGG